MNRITKKDVFYYLDIINRNYFNYSTTYLNVYKSNGSYNISRNWTNSTGIQDIKTGLTLRECYIVLYTLEKIFYIHDEVRGCK